MASAVASIPSKVENAVKELTKPSGRPRRHNRSYTGYGKEEINAVSSSIPQDSQQKWKTFAPAEFKTKEEFQRDFVRHVETTLARSMYNCDELAAYQASALSLRDRLLTAWNKTMQLHTTKDAKRVYYLSLEFLMGRAFDNAALNLGIKQIAKDGLSELGFKLEDIIGQERDASLGNGGLGRLAACFLDSLATLNYPAMGYGLRYQYGIFKQEIHDGYQTEFPDYWLTFENPWEIPRPDLTIEVRFYGYVRKYTDELGRERKSWEGGEVIQAVAYDVPIPGWENKTTNNLRLWASKPTKEFDFDKFNAGDYESAVRDQQEAETISAVLYPNDNIMKGKELRLRQQHFWTAASLHDIVRRFKKSKRPWREFPDQVAIQLNDTHPTLAIVELQRILVDVEELEWDEAWEIVTKTFAFTNHTVMPEALEKYSVPLLENLLPRHLQIIYDINLYFLQSVEKKFPKQWDLLGRVSIVEESSPKMIRMAYLAIVGSHNVNGVAELHSELIKTTIFKDFVAIFGTDKFKNVTNGITPRRWLHQANPELSKLIASKLGGEDYLVDFNKLQGLEKFAKDASFRDEWLKVKRFNKARLAKLIKDEVGVDVNPEALFDIQVKRMHEYKRQQMNIFGCIHRYLRLKNMSAEEKKKVVPRVCVFAGKAAPGYHQAKMIIKLINSVGEKVNKDTDIGDLLKVIFLPDYNVSKAEILVPASDLSEHISTAGTEASGTSNMKFALNGGLIIGTVDGANIEIAREVGQDNIFLFGNLSEDVDELRHNHVYQKSPLNSDLQRVFDAILKDELFGDPSPFSSVISNITDGGDYYLVSDDFESYLETQDLVDKTFLDKEEWLSKSINVVSQMGFFTSDRAIKEYAEDIWNVEPIEE